MATLQQAVANLSINGRVQPRMGSLPASAFSSSSIMGVGIAQPPSFVPAKDGERKGITRMMAIRHWERKKVKPNSLPVWTKMHVKIGDTVEVIAGSDKGKVGEIVRVYRHNSKVMVKDVNIKTKHVKGKQEGEAGQIIQVEAPIHSSNVMLYSKKEKVASRAGHKVLEDGRKVRYLLKTGEVLDSPEEWKRLHKIDIKEKK